MKRRGFSLAELMVALVVAGIIGIALTKLVVSQARFVSTQDGVMHARAVARSGLSVMTDELRQVSWQGVLGASKDSISVRIPYAWGIVCGQASGKTIAALIPPDSSRFASAVTAGYAWRDTNGVWSVVEPATRTAWSTSPCWGATPVVTPMYSPSGTNYAVGMAPNNVATPDGALIYMYQKVTYKIAASVELPGRKGLWRTVIGGTGAEELVAPLDSASRFTFLVGTMLVNQTTVPVLDSLRGVRVNIIAASETTPSGKQKPVTFSVASDIVFRNREQ